MSEVRTIKVALAGCGTVGSGVAEIVVDRADELAARTGLCFEITSVLVADPQRTRYVALDPGLFTATPADFLRADADMVVEVIGGTSVARDVVLAALRAGRPVVTANKALLALHGVEVFRTARQAGTCVAFEASCAGGLPVIGALLHGLTANRIDRLVGILNSTCNYILTQMREHGESFADALAEAQRRGYAEADPTLDVAGWDTAHKLTILASLAFGLNLDFQRVATEGIELIQPADLRIAEGLGYTCKLLGDARRVYTASPAEQGARPETASRTVLLTVHPLLVPHDNPLAARAGARNALTVKGDAVGETCYSGGSAGGLPTASGVVADMIDVATGTAQCTFQSLRTFNDLTPPADYFDPGEELSAFYVRLSIDDAAVNPAELERRWPQAVPLQLIRVIDEPRSVVLITAPLAERRFRAALQHMLGSIPLTAQPVVLRVLTG